ncbi:MAG TPA: hypothetical protein VIJ07_25685 [Dermatophilaceae bacterium]
MTTTGLEVRLHEGRERAEVTRFTKTLDEIVRSLREIDRVYLMRGTRATWVLADLRHDHDEMVVRLEARASTSARTAEDMLVPVMAFVAGAASLNEVAVIPRLFSPTTVERLASLAEAKQGVQSVSVAAYNGQVGPRVALSDSVREHAREAVRPFEISYGSISGVLDLVGTSHRQRGMRLSIYDPAGRQAVDGFVAERLAEELRLMWRHRVLAGGKIKRNRRGQVIRIEVDRIERLPDDDRGRPDTDQVLGMAPDWLNGQSVDQYLREVRGG